MDKNLIVQIPKRHRKSLERRWNIDNFIYEDWGEEYVNRQHCVMCGVHYNHDCNNCPFEQFKNFTLSDKFGCTRWLTLIKAITPDSKISITENEVSIPDRSKVPTRQLKRLIDIASRYIEWV